VSGESSSRVEMDMTPMIDVSFQLLIFFILTINFPVQEGTLTSQLPKHSGSNPTDVKRPVLDPLQLRLRYERSTERTTVRLNGNTVASWRDGETVTERDRRELGSRAADLYETIYEPDADQVPPIRIDASSNVPSGRSIIVMDVIKKHVLDRPDFRGPEGERPRLEWSGNRRQTWGRTAQ